MSYPAAVVISETGLRAALVTGDAELDALASDWQRLWRADARRHVFLSWPWARAWRRAYGATHRPCVAVVRQGGVVAGILPLAHDGDGLHFLGSPDADYTDLLCEESNAVPVLEAALDAVLAAMPRWRRCLIENLPDCSRVAKALPHIRPDLQKRLALVRKGSCPAVTATPAEPDPFRPRARKESIRRHDKKLRALGEIAFRHVEDPAEIARLLPEFVRQHIARRAMAGDRSLLLAPAAVEFYRCLAEELDARGALRFAVLEAAGRPLAFHLGFEEAGRFIWYKPAFDIDYWDWSPGEVLIGRLLDYASAQGLREFDFTIGDESFKYRFANVVRPLYKLHVYAPGARGWALKYAFRLKEILKRTAVPLKAVSAARTWIRSARERGLRALRRLFCYREAVVFRRGSDPAPQSGCGFETSRARLSDLALLSRSDPGRYGPAYLRAARERIKRGDRCYLTRAGGRIAHVLWAGERNQIDAPGFGPECRIPLAEAAVVLFDRWSAGLLAPALLAVVRAEQPRGSEVWTWCAASDRTAREEIEAAGFRPACRLRDIRVCGLRFGRMLEG